jgi:hypothetical protein
MSKKRKQVSEGLKKEIISKLLEPNCLVPELSVRYEADSKSCFNMGVFRKIDWRRAD